MHWKVWVRVFGGDGYIYAWDFGSMVFMVVALIPLHIIELAVVHRRTCCLQSYAALERKMLAPWRVLLSRIGMRRTIIKPALYKQSPNLILTLA